MTQKELFPEQFIETVTCPVCGNTVNIDDYDCGGLPDGVLQCNALMVDDKGRYSTCQCFIDTRTMTEWDGSGDDEFAEES